MRRLQIQLVIGLGRHEAHRPPDRLRDGLCVDAATFVGLHVQLLISRTS